MNLPLLTGSIQQAAAASGVTAQADIDHWWKMDTGVGSDIADAVGSKNLAVTNATSVSATSWKGASLDVVGFDGGWPGSNDKLDVDGSTAFTGDNISFTFWMYPTATPGNYDHFFAQPAHGSFGSGKGLGLYWISNNLNFWVNHYNSKKATISMPASDEWHHVACVLDVSGSLQRIYVTTEDGSTTSGTDYTAAVVSPLNGFTGDITSFKFSIGGAWGYYAPFRVSDFRVYGKTLSQAEVEAISGDGTPGDADWP